MAMLIEDYFEIPI